MHYFAIAFFAVLGFKTAVWLCRWLARNPYVIWYGFWSTVVLCMIFVIWVMQASRG